MENEGPKLTCISVGDVEREGSRGVWIGHVDVISGHRGLEIGHHLSRIKDHKHRMWTDVTEKGSQRTSASRFRASVGGRAEGAGYVRRAVDREVVDDEAEGVPLSGHDIVHVPASNQRKLASLFRLFSI